MTVVPFDLLKHFYFASNGWLFRSFKNLADTVICLGRNASHNVCPDMSVD